MTLQEIIREVKRLTPEERKQLAAMLTDPTEAQPERDVSILEFRGVGSRLRTIDARDYVNQLRAEWDDRP